jgi:hypothetical protein
MSERTSVIERTVIAAISAACMDSSTPVESDSEVLHLLDSVGMMCALADIQGELRVALEPEQLIRIFGSHRVRDIVSALECCDAIDQK